ncbi:MAG: non-ribosomal peptide synthase/polyketide synthase [Acidobacteriia bacterium]|nr:non-ribosomal peptide synthase/polyketide synthase [Terriglobia bacterium]
MPNNFSNLNELLLWRTEHSSGQPVLTFLQNGEKEEVNWNYEELTRRAWSIAALLQSSGSSGETVLLLYPPGPDFIAAFWGCLAAGAIAVPVYPPRSNRNLLRLKAVIQDSQAHTVLTTRQTRAKVAPFADLDPQLGSLRYLTTDDLAQDLVREWKPPNVTGDSIAFLQYTSGSTATPKGVMVSHSNLLENEALIQEAFRQTEKSVVVGWLPLYHDMGLIGNMLQPIYAGARCILMPPMAFLERPFRWLNAITRYRATTSGGPNFAYDLCVRKIAEENLSTLDLSSWEVAFNGAEPVRGQTMRRFAERFSPVGFKSKAFTPCYGLAEATLLVSAQATEDEPLIAELDTDALGRHEVRFPSDESGVTRVVSCGQPARGSTVRIVDPETLLPCSPNQIGEIWVSGPSMALGYWNLPAETKHTFQAQMLGSDDGSFLRTGDLGFLRDGQLFVTGRLKDLIIIRGRNYYPQGIEETMATAHPALRVGCGAAFAIEKDREEQLVLVQEATIRSDDELDKAIQSIIRNIADVHELSVHSIVLIQSGTLPKTSSGKLQRHACKKDFLNQRLEVLREWRDTAETRQAPQARRSQEPAKRSAVETWVIEELARRTGIEPAEVDVRQPLMGFGLNSLTAVELCHNLQVRFGVEIASADVFDGLTIADIAKRTNKVAPLLTKSHAEQPSTYPLSHGQRALWVLHQMAPESAAYNISRAIRITTGVDIEALRRALQALVDRHPCLRTVFVDTTGEPVQQVADKAEVCFEYFDAASWSETELGKRLVEQSHRPFSLTQGPLFRAAVYGRSDNNHLLHVAVHHIIADYWSLTLLLEEVGKLYQAYHSKAEPQLPPLECSYANFVEWQRENLAGPEGERLRSYWKEELSGELAPLSLPADHARPPVQTFHGYSFPFVLESELTEKLKLFAAEHQTTLFSVLLAAFQILLYRLTSQKQITVGCPVAGRSRAEFANTVGYFVNAVPLRADFQQRQTFTDFLSQIRQRVLHAFAHDQYPFSLMVEQLGIARDPATSPVYQSMFVFQQTYGSHSDDFVRFALGQPGARVALGGLQLESVTVEQQTAQFDLTLTAGECPNGLIGEWEYNSDLFEKATIARWAGSFSILLEGILLNPETPVSQLPVVSVSERNRLLEELNCTEFEYDREQCLHELIAAQAKNRPGETAIVWGETEITFAELNARANQLARRLVRMGVQKKEDLVGICMRRSPDMVVAMLAIWKAGAAYVPLDPQYPAERLRFMLEDAGARVVITEEVLGERVYGGAATVLCFDRERELIQNESREQINEAVSSRQPAYLIYTSGSSGVPKGVVLTHRNATAFVAWAQRTFTQEEFSGVLAATSVCFDLSIFELWATLGCGGTVVLADDVLGWWESLREGKISNRVRLVNTVPSAIAKLIEQTRLPNEVVTINLAGEALKSELVTELWQSGNLKRVNNLYGPTETTTYSSWTTVEPQKKVTIGRGTGNTRLYVMDQELELAPFGVVGELYIAGAGVGRGYWKRASLTAERFLPDPNSKIPGERMYRTGDLVRWNNAGELEYLGRADQQVKLRGYRIELGEIEAALSSHSAVRENAVVVKESGLEKWVVAYAAPRPGMDINEGQLREYLQERIPRFMVPSQFVILENLPKTPNGKVDRKLLPDPVRSIVKGRKPQNETEETLAAIWAQVIHLEQVGIDENFFDLGGHSLLATQVMSRVRQVFGVDLQLRCLLENPTVAGLALQVEKATRITAPPLRPVPRKEHARLSFAQERLWFLSRYETEASLYNVPVALRLQGPLNKRALHAALQEIVDRHEVLRTSFPENEGAAVQSIAPVIDLPMPVLEMLETEMPQFLRHESRLPFNLATGPVIRASLLQLSNQDHVLVVVLHHIVCDGWSMGIMLQELTELYDAFSRGDSSPLAPLQVQYADFAEWQREWLQGELLEKQTAYWKAQLAGVEPLNLPTDRPHPAKPVFTGGSEVAILAQSVTAEVRSFSRRQAVTLFMTLLAAFKILLRRYSGQTDIAVGSPIANRAVPETEPLIGFFVNTLVLRSASAADSSVAELLQQVREVSLQAYAHQDVPFERLVEILDPARNLGRTPLFQTMFVLQNTPLPNLPWNGLKATPRMLETGTSKFDITLAARERDEELELSLEYSTESFDAERMKRLLQHYQNLLQGMILSPERCAGEIDILSAAERKQLLVEWKGVELEYEREKCLPELLEEQARRTPEAVAVVSADGQLTYAELNRKANQLGQYLRQLGVGPEVRVAICLERGRDLIVGLMGILKAGGAYVPLDGSYPKERLQYMVEDAEAAVVLTQTHLLGDLNGFGGRVVLLEKDRETIEQESGETLKAPTTPENLAYVIYTSGSTGRPRGVAITHRSATVLLHWARESFSAEELSAVLASTSICFDLSVFEIFVPLSCGGTVFVVKDVLELAKMPEPDAIKLVNTVPSAMRELVRIKAVPQSVRTVNLAGEALTWGLVQDVYGLGSAARVCNLYGPSEDTTYSTYAWLSKTPDAPAVPIGKPLANTQAYVLDGRMELLPVGVVGELYLAGAGLARGYLNRPELTAEKFVPNPFSTIIGQRLYRTGDLASYRPDGNLDYQGRIDHQVKVRGYRIELTEIEAALEEIVGVTQAVVVAADDSGEKRLVAYAAVEEGINPPQLKTALRKRLPEFMVPSDFVLLDRLPLTPNGKIDRRALPSFRKQRDEGSSYAEPRTAAEELIAQIWEDLLGIEHVGLHDNFFVLGGHSLLATRMLARVRETFHREIELRAIFEFPVLQDLATHVDSLTGEWQADTALPLVRVQRLGPLPLSSQQERLWFLDLFNSSGAAYNLPAAVRLKGNLNREALEWSFQEILRRHEILRARFVQTGAKPQLEIDEGFRVELPQIDVPDSTAGIAAQDWIHRELTEEAARPFELAEGRLFRTKLLRLGENEYILLITVHHIVFDGWSVGVLVNELRALYETYSTKSPLPLPDLEIQYVDYASWQRELLETGKLAEGLGYWKKYLQALPVLELPSDYPRPAVQSFRGANEEWVLAAEVNTGLKALGREHRVTLFMSLLAGLQILLARYSGQEDIAVGSPVANRPHAQLQSLIGFFVNTLVLRGDLSGNPPVREVLHRTRETCLSAYKHQTVPLEKLVDSLEPQRDLSRNPLFQVAMILQNAPAGTMQLPGLEMTLLRPAATGAKFDLTLVIEEGPQGLHGFAEYCADLFEPKTIRQMLGHYSQILREMVRDFQQCVSTLPLLTEAEHRQLLFDWNETTTVFASRCIHELFEEQARSTPDAVALEYEKQELSYAELNRRANQLGHYLRKQGVGPETRVGICLERSFEMVVGLLGILKAGGAYLPLDPGYPQERLAYMLQDGKVPVLLTQERFRSQLRSFDGKVVALDEQWDGITTESAANPKNITSLQNLVYVIYTSGSTGQPKGAMNIHGGLCNRLQWMQQQYGLNAGDRVLQKTPFTFDVSVWEFFWPLITGARLVMARPGGHQDADYISTTIQSSSITTIHFVPSMLSVWLESEGAASCTSLKRVICSGEALGLELQKRFQGKVGAELHNLYGPTEASIDVTFWHCQNDESRFFVPIGRPIANTQVYVLDNALQPVPVGVKGELYLGGMGLARGYLAQPGMTAEKFIPHPFSLVGGERLYRTGDAVRWRKKGELEYLGRLDHQVKLRGFRIELGEIETRLLEHEAVSEAVVTVREDTPGDKRLVAYLVPDRNCAHPVTQFLKFDQSGEFPRAARYELPNGMVISHQNKNETDFVYQEIFERRTYLQHGITLRNDACVVDVGANIGLFTLSILERAPQARIYAFEPIPPVFENLRINSLLAGGDIHLFNCGLSSVSGTADFTWFKHNSVISGRYADLKKEQGTIKTFLKNQNGAELSEETLETLIEQRLDHEKFRCTLRTLSEVIAAERIERIDLLKIDVEKSELEVFEGIEDKDWAKIRQLVIEVHDIEGRLRKMRHLLEVRGYEVSVEQDDELAATDLYTIFARRPETIKQGNGSYAPSSRVERVYWNSKQLETALRAHLSAKLPSYMVPNALVFLPAMPLTANGKIDKKALPALKSASKPSPGPKLPLGETERILAQIWKQILRIDEVGIEDKFFDVGGHSLLIPELRLEVQKAFGKNLPIVDFFQYPTIRSLAERLEGGRSIVRVESGRRSEIVETGQPGIGTTEFAIIGMVGRFPGAANLEEFWQNLEAGVESITDFSDEELRAAGISEELLGSPNFVKRGPVVANVDLFDARFFDVSAREAEMIDPQQRIFLECAWEALENAGYAARNYPGKIGLYAGSGPNTYVFNLLGEGNFLYSKDAAPILFANSNDFLATRVSYKLNLTGPSLTIQTACSTSLVAVHMACRALFNHECDMALAGGITIRTPQKVGDIFQEGSIVSPDGHCRTFDEQAQGTVRGNGAGVVVIKRLEDALRDRDHIRAVIKGSAINNDGSDKVGYTAPSITGQCNVIQEALRESGVKPETITCLEAHGTATPLGDPIEISALTQAYRGMGAEKNAFCAIGSVKSNIGHADSAAGVAGLIKTVLALEHKQIPPTLHCERTNPQIDFDHSPFYVNTKLAEWKPESLPRRAGVSSFGIGGTNAHVILEEAPTDDAVSACRPWQLVLLSAKTATALESAVENLEAYLRKNQSAHLADVAHTLQVGRATFAHRCLVVAESTAEATERFKTRHTKPLPASVVSHEGLRPVFVFPGQGTQYVNMGKHLYAHEPLFHEVVDQCSELLRPELQLDLRSVLYPSPQESQWAETELRETRTTQPTIFVIEYALARMWMSWGVMPDSMLGHSIGEYVAACLAGVFSLEDALKLVAVRGRLMQSCERGGMLAVAASENEVQIYLKAGLELAAINGSRSCVLSGPLESLELAEKELVKQQVVHRRLASSHAFHSAMMEPIVDQFVQQVRRVRLNAPQMRYLSNVTGDWIAAEQTTDPAYWGKQLRHTVQFADGIRNLCSAGARVTLEVGPGHTSHTAMRQTIAKADLPTMLTSLPESQTGESDVKHVLTTLGHLWLQGARIDWNEFASGEKRRRIPLPTYPFERQRFWVDAPGSRLSHAEGSRKQLKDWLYLPCWKETARVAPARKAEGSEKTRLLVFSPNSRITSMLVEKFEQRRYEIVNVVAGQEFARTGPEAYAIRPAARADYDTLFSVLQEQGQFPQKILHLWNTGPAGSLEYELDRALYSPLHVVQAATAIPGVGRIQCMVVSSGLHEITGNEDVSPAKATLLGLCRTVSQELPDFVCRSVDIEVPSEGSWMEHALLDQLICEFESEEQQPIVSYRGARRWIQTFDQALLEAGEPDLVREGGVYLITGGLNDVGFQFAEWLASQMHASVVLVDRRSFPLREHWSVWPETHTGDPAVKQINRIRSWEQNGARVLISNADVADEDQMRDLCKHVRAELGVIHGVIHAAGVFEAEPIAAMTDDHVSALLTPKVHGALVLDRIFAEQDLDFMVFCSSLVSMIGEAKHAGYAAANAFLDSLARRNFFRNRCFVLSINWDAWTLSDDSRSCAVTGASEGIRQEEAVEVLRRLLRAKPGPQAVISTRDLAWLARKKTSVEEEAAEATERAYARPNLDHPVEPPTNTTETLLVRIWTEVLGVSPIGINDDFFELGGDSLIGLKLTARSRDLGIQIAVAQLFRNRTIRELAAAVDQVALAEKIPPIVRIPRNGTIPLSYTQQRVWFIDRMTPDGSAYNIPAAVRIKGFLDLTVLERVLHEIISRHESLRTRFEIVDSGPRQVIDDTIAVPLSVIDLSSGTEDVEKTARIVARDEIQKPFDLQRGPLIRTCLLRLAEQEHVLVMTMHHTVSDGWSLGILVREVSVLYKAFSAGEPSPLAELPIQYADYSAWQRQWISGDVLEQQLNYWKQQLAGVPVLDLPTDFARPLIQSQRGGIVRFKVSLELTVKLKEICLQHGTTLYMTLLAAFQTLMSRYSRQHDITTGTAIAGRRRTETESLIGFFVNTLVLRTDLSGAPAFAALLQQVKQTTLEAYAHQDVPFEKLVEVLSPDRDLGRSPLYQVMFGLQNAPYATLELGQAKLERYDLENLSAECDLNFDIAETADGMGGYIRYSADLFEADTISRWIEHFKVLLAGIAADPQQSIATIALLTSFERRQLVEDWNQTEVARPNEKLLTDLIEEQAHRKPNAIAVSSEEGHLTYAELNAQANQIARYLRRFGVGPEVPVGMCMERNLEMVKGLLGIFKAGGVYLPLDPAYPLERLLDIAADSKARVMLVQEKLVKELPRGNGKLIKVGTDWPQISQEESGNLEIKLSADNLAYVIYASGSSGGPKGAMNTHAGILNRLLWMQDRFSLKEDDHILQKTPICFDISLWEFFWPLLTGAELVMANPGGHLDPDYVAKVIREKQITTLHFVPSALRMFLESSVAEKCGSLRRVICSGEVLTADLQSAFFGQFQSELHNLYGPTEASIDVTSWSCERSHNRPGIPIGKPIANTQIYVLDEFMEPVPVGVTGELFIGGAGLSRGYLGQAALTAQGFVPNPFSTVPGERLYRTGDLARFLPDGNIEFLGRIDNQIKLNGHRIEPGEIEEIIQSYPGVHQAVVVTDQDDKDVTRLVTYVMPRVGQVVNAVELKNHIRQKLPEAMVPGVIVEIAELPLTASGKIDRKRLPKVERMSMGGADTDKAPRTEIERYIAEIWQQELQLTSIGVHDNFFDLGGHSLLLVTIQEKLAVRFNDQLTVIDLFTYPTIATLAKFLEQPQDDAPLEMAATERADLQLQAFAAVRGGRSEDQ